MFCFLECTAEQFSALFKLDGVQINIAHASAANFWCPVNKEKYTCACPAAKKFGCFFCSAYSNMNFIKN